MANKLGRDTYAMNSGTQAPMAKSNKVSGINPGALQNGGGNQFNSFGTPGQIALQSKYDQEAIDSIVNFADKMNEPRLQEQIAEQQAFGMQAVAKGVAFEDIKKAQPYLSKFFGDTIVMDSARAYEVQDKTTKRILDLKKDLEKDSKMSPDEYRNKLVGILDSNLTGDRRADAMIAGNFFNEMPNLMKDHFVLNFKYQQNELARQSFNTVQSTADALVQLRNDRADGVIQEPEYKIRKQALVNGLSRTPETMTEATRSEYYKNATQLAISTGNPDLLEGLLPRSVVSTLSPELQVFSNNALRLVQDQAAVRAQNDPEYQTKRAELDFQLNSLSQQRLHLIDADDIPASEIVGSQANDLITNFNNWYKDKYGVDMAHLPVSPGDVSKIESGVQNTLYSHTTRQQEAQLKAQQDREGDLQKFAGIQSAKTYGKNLAVNGESPDFNEIVRLADKFGIDYTQFSNIVDSEISNYSKKIDDYRESLFDTENFHLKNQDLVAHGKEPLTERQYSDLQLQEIERLRNEAKNKEMAKNQDLLTQKQNESQMKDDSFSVLSYNENFTNIDQVNQSPSIRNLVSAPKEIRQTYLDGVVGDTIAKIQAGKATDQDIKYVQGLMVANHTTLGSPIVHSNVLKKIFGEDMGLFDPKRFKTNVGIFKTFNKNPQMGAILQETLGKDVYSRYEAAASSLPNLVNVLDKDVENVWDRTVGAEKLIPKYQINNVPDKPDAEGQMPWQKNEYIAPLADNLPSNIRNNEKVNIIMKNANNIFQSMLSNDKNGTDRRFLAHQALAEASQGFDLNSSETRIYQSNGGEYGLTLRNAVTSSGLGVRFNPRVSDRAIDTIIRTSESFIDNLPTYSNDLKLVSVNGVSDQSAPHGFSKQFTFFDRKQGKNVVVNMNYEQEKDFDSFVEYYGYDKNSVNVVPIKQGNQDIFRISYTVTDDDGVPMLRTKYVTKEQLISAYTYRMDINK